MCLTPFNLLLLIIAKKTKNAENIVQFKKTEKVQLALSLSSIDVHLRDNEKK